MHTTANGLDNDTAIEDLGGDFGAEPEERQDRLLRSAERTVADLAPPHEAPPGEAYRQAARDAELAVLEYLLTTQGGILKSQALAGVDSQTFAGEGALQNIVRAAMGVHADAFAQPAETKGNAAVHNVSPEPLW